MHTPEASIETDRSRVLPNAVPGQGLPRPRNAGTGSDQPDGALATSVESEERPDGPVARGRRTIAVLWSPAGLVTVGSFAVLAVVYIYYSYLLGLAGNSDSAINVLEGWDISHGRPLLHGWVQGNNSFMTDELLLYAAAAYVLGVTPGVIYVSQGIIYAAIVVLAGLLAMSAHQGRGRRFTAAAMVGAMLLSVTRENTGWMTLSIIDHLGTSIPLMVLLLVLDRARLSWRLGVVAFVILTWAMISDHLVLYVGVLPIMLAAGWRAYFQNRNRIAYLALIAGAALSVPGDSIAKTIIEALGGASRNKPPDAIFATVSEMSANVWETVDGVMTIFGASLMGRAAQGSKVELLHVGVVVTAVIAWIVALRAIRAISLVDQILIVAISVNILAFFFSSLPGPQYTAHELLVVVPFSAVLAGRLLVPRLTTIRAQVPVYVALAMSAVVLAHTLTGPKTPDPYAQLAQWLKRENLSYGLSGFWQAASVTVLSKDRTTVRAVINDNHGNITPFWQVMRDDWYDPSKHDARFVISVANQPVGGIDDVNPILIASYFGPPARLAHVGIFTISIFDHNILPALPREPLPHQR